MIWSFLQITLSSWSGSNRSLKRNLKLINDLKELHYGLKVNFKICRVAHTITTSQRKYIENIFKHFNMENANCSEPLPDVNFKLLRLSDEEFGNMQRKTKGILYKTPVELLKYATIDIKANFAFTISTISFHI